MGNKTRLNFHFYIRRTIKTEQKTKIRFHVRNRVYELE